VKVGFASMYDVVSEEYRMHNFGSIVAAVGGAVGLFLGMSLYRAMIFFIDKLFTTNEEESSQIEVFKEANYADLDYPSNLSYNSIIIIPGQDQKELSIVHPHTPEDHDGKY